MLQTLFFFARSAFYGTAEERSFVQWMRENGVMYYGDEYFFRFGIFLVSLNYVSEFNRKSNFRISLNAFAAHTPAEYRDMLNSARGLQYRTDHTGDRENIDKNIPESVDWRTRGIVSDVRDQGAHCGASWAFAAICSQESSWALSHNELYNLSVENIIDCCTLSNGCSGGCPYEAFQYVLEYQNGCFMTEEDYPYVGIEGVCRFDESKAKTKTKGYKMVRMDDEDDMAYKCARYGVVAALVDASSFSFQLYSSGIYEDDTCSSWKSNLSVCVVGYGKEEKTPYWILRNSWGSSWGEFGYMRFLRNANSMCGIASMSFVPISK